jgi:flagellar FliL protein
MAAEKDAPPAPVRGKSKKLMLIAAIVLLAVAGGGSAAWYFTNKGKANEPAEAAAPQKAPTVFVNLETFTVNLADEGRFLQVGIVYAVAGNEIAEAMKVQMPVIRSRILLLLSSKNADALTGVDGKQKLAEELLVEARAPLAPKGDESIAQVHFSSFVIQ